MQLQRVNVFGVVVSGVRHHTNVKVLRISGQLLNRFASEEADVGTAGELVNISGDFRMPVGGADKNEGPFRMACGQVEQ